MFGFRSHSVMWKIFCTNEALRSAMKLFDFGGIDLVRCLLLRYEETGSVGCEVLSDKTSLRRGGLFRSLAV